MVSCFVMVMAEALGTVPCCGLSTAVFDGHRVADLKKKEGAHGDGCHFEVFFLGSRSSFLNPVVKLK